MTWYIGRSLEVGEDMLRSRKRLQGNVYFDHTAYVRIAGNF